MQVPPWLRGQMFAFLCSLLWILVLIADYPRSRKCTKNTVLTTLSLIYLIPVDKNHIKIEISFQEVWHFGTCVWCMYACVNMEDRQPQLQAFCLETVSWWFHCIPSSFQRFFLCLPSHKATAVSGANATYLVFSWVLKIWTQVLILSWLNLPNQSLVVGTGCWTTP